MIEYNLIAECETDSECSKFFCFGFVDGITINEKFLDLLDDAFNGKKGMKVTAEIDKKWLYIKIWHDLLEHFKDKYLELSFSHD